MSLSWSGVVWYSKNCVILKIQPVASEPSNLDTSSFIRCGAVCEPDAGNEVVSGCTCYGLYLFASRWAKHSDKVSIFVSTVAANFANNSTIFSDERALDLVPSAILSTTCSMKAPMIPSFRGLGNLHNAQDRKKAVETRREGEREFREELREEEKPLLTTLPA